MESKARLTAASLLVAGLLTISTQAGAITIADWTCVGNCGTSGPDGVVTQSPVGSPQYGWVSTDDGVLNVALQGVGGEGEPTNGSLIRSPLFSANAGDELAFYFNYVTTDGAGFADYAWARLLDNAMNQVALLFTARTTPGGDTVPGFEMPTPAATLTPEATPIIDLSPDGPEWSPLGPDSGTCFDDGCGYTDWVLATFTIEADGVYSLEFGVVNWDDQNFQSGLAFDGATIAGEPIENGNGLPPPPPPPPPPVGVPTPVPLGLMGLGLLALIVLRRRG